MIYLDNSATTKVDEQVEREMEAFFKEKYGNASSLHTFGREAKEALEKSRKTVAEKINADPDEIIFVGCGSESDNLAIKGIALSSKKKHIITSKIEHPAVLKTCEYLAKNGFKITYLKVDKEGLIDLEELEKSITDDTSIVSIMHANNEIGTVQDIEKIGAICKEKNALLHTDAVQSFLKEDIDVKKQNIALASFSGHKIHGPKGIGVLYIRKDLKQKIIKQIHGGGQESNLRAGTENLPGIVGFAKAVEIADEKDLKEMNRLRDMLIQELMKIPDTILNGPEDKRLANNVNICFKFIEGESLLMMLDMKGIAVSTGSACSQIHLKPSHVLLAIGLPPEVVHGSIRFTLSKFTTEDEIKETIKAVKEAVEELRKMSPLGR